TDTAATDWYPSLGPDGDTVVFSSRRTGVFEIYRLSLSTGEVVQLTDGMGGSYAPELSPDGSRIVFASNLNGKLDVYVMDADGGNITRLTDHPADDLDPTWSPDGTRVAFASNRTGTNELYIMDVPAAPGELGQNVRQVTNGSNMQEGGRSDWSPDGSTLAFYAGDPGDKDIFLVPVECAEQVEGCGPDALTRLTEGGTTKPRASRPMGSGLRSPQTCVGITTCSSCGWTAATGGSSPRSRAQTGSHAGGPSAAPTRQEPSAGTEGSAAREWIICVA